MMFLLRIQIRTVDIYCSTSLTMKMQNYWSHLFVLAMAHPVPPDPSMPSQNVMIYQHRN